MSKRSKGKSQNKKNARVQVISNNELKRRITSLEETVDLLMHRLIHQERLSPGQIEQIIIATSQRYIKPTNDGWLIVLSSGERISLPSGLSVNLDHTSNGRDYLTVLEGVHRGRQVDVASGFLELKVSRLEQLKLLVSKRSATDFPREDSSYSLKINLSFIEGGVIKNVGPYLAKTEPSNPIPTGRHEIEIPDFPHDLGSNYGAFGKVWFRIGHSGDRYIHPGRISAGCLTCAPGNWQEIYSYLVRARIPANFQSIGILEVT